MEILSHCTLCNSTNIRDFLECEDHFVTGEKFTISFCDDCGFHFTNPRPEHSASSPYYNSSAYISHSRTKSGMVNRLFHLARIYTIRRKKSIVYKYSTGQHILDYGCGTGEFLYSMKKSSWSVAGIEPNAIARKIALEDYMLDIKDEPDFEKIDAGSLDAITLWHVLEHIYLIHERLTSFAEKLKDDGILIAAVPNMKSLDARNYGRYWAAWDVPRHIHHFDRESIEFLFKAHGFHLISVRPMLLDAFYISMLSEKYKSGSSNILKAFFKGLQSNTSAFLNTGNYSSLIYIFKKSN